MNIDKQLVLFKLLAGTQKELFSRSDVYLADVCVAQSPHPFCHPKVSGKYAF